MSLVCCPWRNNQYILAAETVIINAACAAAAFIYSSWSSTSIIFVCYATRSNRVIVSHATRDLCTMECNLNPVFCSSSEIVGLIYNTDSFIKPIVSGDCLHDSMPTHAYATLRGCARVGLHALGFTVMLHHTGTYKTYLHFLFITFLRFWHFYFKNRCQSSTQIFRL